MHPVFSVSFDKRFLYFKEQRRHPVVTSSDKRVSTNSEVDHFYQQLQETIHQTPKKDILVVHGDWTAKVGKDAQADWGDVRGPYYNFETNERGLRLLKFAAFNNLVLTKEDGHGTAQMGNTTTRLLTSW